MWRRAILSKLGQAVKFIICILELAVSNLGQNTDYTGAHKKYWQ
jgi:hypothetical protein